jgi:hypothetical protein
MVKNSTGQNLILNGLNTYSIPSSYQITGQALDTTTSAIAANLIVKGNLSQLVKSAYSAAVWYIENGQKRPIPSYSNLLLLGYPTTPISLIDDNSINSITTGPTKLGNGQAVKSSGSQAVYTIMNNNRILYSSAELYLAYGNKWSDIETYDNSFLDSNYPIYSSTASRYLATSNSDINYLVDGSGCKLMTSSMLSSYGQSQASLPVYSKDFYPRLNISNCQPSSNYARGQSTSTVYYIDNGQKRAFKSWSSLISYSGTQPKISIISDSTINLLPTGSPI